MTQAPQQSPQAQALAAELYAVLKGRTLSSGLVLAALDLVRDQISRRRAALSYRDPALIDLAERTRQASPPPPHIRHQIAQLTGRNKGEHA